MLGWLYRLLIGKFNSCDHNWETIETIRYFGSTTPAPGELAHGYSKHLHCTKCGIWKSQRMH